MRRKVHSILLLLSFCVLITPVCMAQLPAPAVPIAEAELRNNSIKVRARALEIFRQESRKKQSERKDYVKENFESIRKDFVNIQLRQDEIIKIYTTQRVIDFVLVKKASSGMVASAKRLHGHLFPDVKKSVLETADPKSESANLRDSIVKVDNALSRFVNNPMFKKKTVLSVKNSEKARRDLELIIHYASRIGIIADNQSSTN